MQPISRSDYFGDYSLPTTKVLGRLAAYVLSAQFTSSLLSSYEPPAGSPGFYHGNSTAAVTFDAHSLFLDDKRLYVFSGEVHTWRMPSGPAMWRDVFQKMRVSDDHLSFRKTLKISFPWCTIGCRL